MSQGTGYMVHAWHLLVVLSQRHEPLQRCALTPTAATGVCMCAEAYTAA